MATLNRPIADRPASPEAGQRRRFRFFDFLILGVATAAGCGVTQVLATTGGMSTWTDFMLTIGILREPEKPGEAMPLGERESYLLKAVVLFSNLNLPTAMLWSLALIPIRLIGPRPPRRRLCRQPGWVASLAIGLAVAFLGLPVLVAGVIVGPDRLAGLFQIVQIESLIPMFLGLAVLTAWTPLWLGRLWRAERGWVDRLGRVMGVLWILAGVGGTGLFLWYTGI